jgi:uncharacterized protein YcsI (UPF0317 family)
VQDLLNLSPSGFWSIVRDDNFIKPTSGVCKGYAQANLVILPEKYALDFLTFCVRNPKPCPVIDILDKGSPTPPSSPGADIRTDIPMYRLYEKGVVTRELNNILDLWREDFVTFLLGCSFSFEWALLNAGLPIRHIDQSCNVPMYKTNIKCKEAGIFKGNNVVSMRPFKGSLIPKVIEITSRMPSVHGAPIHVGDPKAIGINDINTPDFGDAVRIEDGEIPVFWACGVTPQLVALESKPDFMITHSPGYMFVTGIKNEDLNQ